MAISRDITERKKAEKALEKSRNNLELKVKERETDNIMPNSSKNIN